MCKLVDHHIHFLENNKPFDEGAVVHYLNKAREKSIKIIGFNEHAYMFNEAKSINFNKWQNNKRIFDLKDYIKTVDIFKEKAKEFDIEVLMGLEIDYIPQRKKQIRSFINTIKKNKFDFVSGSIHWIRDWPIDLNKSQYQNYINKRGEQKVLNDYYILIKKLVKSNLFNFVCHVDLIKIFGLNLRKKSWQNYWGKILNLCNEYNVGIEINTNGKNKPAMKFYPDLSDVKKAIQKNITITFSSDAHSYDRIGDHFGELQENFVNMGGNKIFYYKNFDRKYLDC